MATVAKICGQPDLAQTLLEKAARGHCFADLVWAYMALQSQRSPDAPHVLLQIRQLLLSAGSLNELNLYTSYHWYGVGLLQRALSQRDQAIHSFQNALMLPDKWMAHHLSRVALDKLTAQR